MFHSTRLSLRSIEHSLFHLMKIRLPLDSNCKREKTYCLHKEKVIFNQWNKACFPLFFIWLYVIKEMVRGLACSIELWYLGSWDSTKIYRVALGYGLKQFLHFFLRSPSYPCASITWSQNKELTTTLTWCRHLWCLCPCASRLTHVNRHHQRSMPFYTILISSTGTFDCQKCWWNLLGWRRMAK